MIWLTTYIVGVIVSTPLLTYIVYNHLGKAHPAMAQQDKYIDGAFAFWLGLVLAMMFPITLFGIIVIYLLTKTR
jgi:hypothetical protein